MVIAVDFDGTLCEHRFPDIGAIKNVHREVIKYLQKQKELGSTIILWTCREDLPVRKFLTEAVEFCKENNIPIDYVNEYPMQMHGYEGFASRKVCADLYIDDKAVNTDWFS